jgi:hypothetical protein
LIPLFQVFSHVILSNRYTGLVDLFTMDTGAFDVVFGATQCAAGAGIGLPPPRLGVAFKGDAAMALYNLSKREEIRDIAEGWAS